MEEFFIIPHHNIDGAWNPPDRSFEFYILEYCEEVLDIPLYMILNASFTHNGLEIELQNLEETICGEDWYINLFRVSNYMKAS